MTYCEARQEAWIDSLFSGRSGYAVDVGANDGRFLSNTLAAEEAGWTVLCVEANPECEPSLRASRRLVEICACSSAAVESADFWINDAFPPAGSSLVKHGPDYRKTAARVETLSRLLAKHDFPRLDLLSIDVEHTDLDVLRGIDLDVWKPKAIIVESIGEPLVDSATANATEAALTEYLSDRGYRKAERSQNDLLFVWIEP